MEYSCLDPYEQQLLKVFNSYDFENHGSLDREGLNQLCCTLQLEEQGTELVQRLLHDPKHSRISFVEFKEALLALLGNIQNRKENLINKEEDAEKGSPDREVSPKFVFGSKKYGRRSRPRTDESPVSEQNENMNYTNKLNYNTSVQRSNSQNDVVHSKKRKQNTKLKRCTSFPGNHDYQKGQEMNNPSSGNEVALRKTCEKLGVGEDGYLNQTELVLVCDAIGLHRLAKGVIKQLSSRLEMDEERRISFHELLDVLQQDETWSEVLNPPAPIPTLNIAVTDSVDNINQDSKITLGPEGTGFINTDVIVDMWENIGIASPKLLLQELGFINPQINVAELAATLDREIKNINEVTTPQIILLQAILSLYKSEITCLKNISEQMHAEREKLKNDVIDANNRATMLAQEVDDNHARMELSTQNQVKLLEQKHVDVLKQITEQFVNDKEQLNLLNQNLEVKIQQLELEENKLQNELMVAQKYSSVIEKENQLLSGQVSELQQVREVLSEQVKVLENEKQNYECETDQIEPLLIKLSELQMENAQLRDRTDEMLAEIETLNSSLASRPKVSTPTYNVCDQSMDENVSSCSAEGVGIGAKRRSDESPSKDLNTFGIGVGSPRLGKLRKCTEIQLASSESGIGTEFDELIDSSSISGNETEDIARLQAKILQLEQILKEHSIPIPAASNFNATWDNDSQLKELKTRYRHLETLFSSIRNEVTTALSDDRSCTCDLECVIRAINRKLEEMVFVEKKNSMMVTETETDDSDLKKLIEKYQVENGELNTKCSELSNCIELLRAEYERCEDYWAAKLDEERQIFESEQQQSNQNLTELLSKITEYESQFPVNDEPDYRLPPIEEKYNLEKQFTDLEQEYEEYREHVEYRINEKDNEIADLKEKLNSLNVSDKIDAAVQTDHVSLEEKLRPLSSCIVETTNLPSQDAMPFNWTNQQNVLDTNNVWNKNPQEIPMNIPWQTACSHRQVQQPLSIINIPSTSTDNSNTSAPIRPKRSRKHDKNSYKMHHRLNRKEKEKECENHTLTEQTVTLPLLTVHNINAQLHHLEQRCRHLQMVLKQQHYRAEQIMQNCWQQHRSEKADLQYRLKNNQDKLEQQMKCNNDQLERLARTDMIVKDLYVENAYLIANVQRLENQCRLLSQYNSASSSV